MNTFADVLSSPPTTKTNKLLKDHINAIDNVRTVFEYFLNCCHYNKNRDINITSEAFQMYITGFSLEYIEFLFTHFATLCGFSKMDISFYNTKQDCGNDDYITDLNTICKKTFYVRLEVIY